MPFNKFLFIYLHSYHEQNEIKMFQVNKYTLRISKNLF